MHNKTRSYVTTKTARVDLDRTRRRGLPEVVFCQNKSPAQVQEIFAVFEANGQIALGTRATEAHFEAVRKMLPTAVFEPISRLLLFHPHLGPEQAHRLLSLENSVDASHLEDAPHSAVDGSEAEIPYIAVVSAGTSDEPILREAVGTLKLFGHRVRIVNDAGVAGLQRILDLTELLERALVIIVVAGMDGALPSVVAGLVPTPVIAVPTSVGYGASFGGLSALLAMLNNCSGGVSVVNIDNGFGAAYTASLIARKVMQHETGEHPVTGADS